MKRFLACGLAILALAACAAPVGGCTSVIPNTSHTLVDEKSLLGAELLFSATEQSVGTAVDIGVLHGPTAAQAAVLLNKAHDALAAARTAQALGEATTVNSKVADALQFIAQAKALAGK